MSRLNDCVECGRGPMTIYPGGLCVNCHNLKMRGFSNATPYCTAVRKFTSEACIEVGMCQLCAAKPAVVVFDSATLHLANNANDDTLSQFLSRMFDFTACCFKCARSCEKNELPVAHMANLPEVLFRGPKADHYVELFEMAEAEAMREAESAPVPVATTARPGSAEKLEVMRQRAERGELLFSPDDSTDTPVFIPQERDDVTQFPSPVGVVPAASRARLLVTRRRRCGQLAQ